MDQQNKNELTRRVLLSGGAALATTRLFAGNPTQEAPAAAPHSQANPAAGSLYAYLGSFTTARRYARGDGIHVYRVDPATGAWTHVQHVDNVVNPSFLALGPDQRCLYSVHGDQTYASSFAVDRETGRLTPLNRAETGGLNGTHLAVDPSGKFLLIANYASGSIAVLPVRQDGTLGRLAQLVPLEGQPGPHRVEQTSSHPHQIVFDPSGRYVIVPDKGLDRIFVFRFDPAAAKLTPTEQGSALARPGSGPRHAAFHPSLSVLWVINELNSTVATYFLEPDPGALRPVQILPSLPSDYTGQNTGAEIAASSRGRFVYCSNRGHDSIAIFAADARTGLLTSVGWLPTQGRTPRFIGFDPSRRFLYAANEQSDTVVSFRADSDTGHLTPTSQVVRSGTPVVIAFGNGGI